MLSSIIQPVDKLTSPWPFVASQPNLYSRVKRVCRGLFHRWPAPRYEVIKPLSQRDLWFVYFVYAPDGSLSAAHRFTLARLRDMNVNLFVVMACGSPSQIGDDVTTMADALYWKALDGFDFSAYTIALRAVAEVSPHATVYVQNDSVYGPLCDVRPFIEHAPWEMLGFTASSGQENHIQSYAFVLRDVTPTRMSALADVLPLDTAYSHIFDVIECQEVRLARVAAQSMSVGACWFGNTKDLPDPVLARPVELVNAGFPFVKRSIYGGKHHETFAPHAQDELRDLLMRAQHPV